MGDTHTNTGNDFSKAAETMSMQKSLNRVDLHPLWRAFVRYCCELQHGEIERLKIQDGLPVLAEVTTKKVKFAP
jgi:hypothetical protein